MRRSKETLKRILAFALTAAMLVSMDSVVSIADDVNNHANEVETVKTELTQDISSNVSEDVSENISDNEIVIDNPSYEEEENSFEEDRKNVSYSGSAAYNSSVYAQRLKNVQLTGNNVTDVIAIAESQIGYHEGSSAYDYGGGNAYSSGNYTEYCRWFYGYDKNVYWCAIFVTWVVRQAGISSNFIASSAVASANAFGNWFYTATGGYNPVPGDFIHYDRYKVIGDKWYEGHDGIADHVGIIYKVDSTYVYSIEGNSNDKVQYVQTRRDSDGILGYSSPKYPTGKEQAPAAPTISTEKCNKGRNVIVSGAGNLYVSIDNGAYNRYNGPISVTNRGWHTVKAYATNSSGASSKVVDYGFDVVACGEPYYTATETANGVLVTLDPMYRTETIYYSLNGGSFYQYSNRFLVSKTSTLRFYSSEYGYTDSDIVSKDIYVGPPTVPTVSLGNTTNKVAVGDNAIIKWTSSKTASKYKLRVYENGSLVETFEETGTTATYPVSDAKRYYFTVSAENVFGASAESQSVFVEGMPDVTIQFLDDDGETALSEIYTVKYGSSVTPPKAPSKEGHTFQGWKGNYENIITDTKVVATYEINTYYVIFKDDDEKTVISSQKVKWHESAIEPDMAGKAHQVGYAFAGWNIDQSSECKDFTCVDGKMILYASYAWEHEDLPVVVKDLEASVLSNKAGQYYLATMNLYCNPDDDIIGRVVVVLQTEKGTTLAVTTQDVSMKAGESTIPTSVKLNSSADGGKISAYVVGITEDGNTIGAYSEKQTTDVIREIYYSDWSEWSTTPRVPDADTQIDIKTQYRYNTKSTTTSSSKTLDGWKYVSRSSTYGSYSSWSDSYISSFENESMKRVVSTREVVDESYDVWGHYCTGNVPGAEYQTSSSNNSNNSIFNNNCTYHEIGTFLAGQGNFVKHPDGAGYYFYPYGTSSSYKKCSNGCFRWYKLYSYDTTRTQYRYYDVYYTYHFEKISDFSEWSDEMPSGDYNALETRTLYRYRTVVDRNEITEVDATEPVTVSGTVNAEGNLEGKTATVLVYKKTNTDPTQSQLEYVDQITIGSGNSFAVTVLPKENPTADTGDFIVSLAIANSSRLVNVEVIEAPKPEYTVTFKANGVVVKSETVPRHGSVEVPNAPVVEGMNFVRWDTSTTDVTDDLEVEAIYTVGLYVVVYVDSKNNTVDITRASYGDSINKAAPADPEGFTFEKWDQETVTGDMIVNAVFKPRTYEVSFMNLDGTLCEKKTAPYGGAVIPPAYQYLAAPAGAQIVGWSTDSNWSYVTCDMTVYPIVKYNNTAMAPVTTSDVSDLMIWDNGEVPNFATDSMDGAVGERYEYPTIELVCDTENVDIYYTTDGTDPSVDDYINGISTKKYTGPIDVTEEMTVKAVSVAANMNMSSIVAIPLHPYVLSMQMLNALDEFDNGNGEPTEPEEPKELVSGLEFEETVFTGSDIRPSVVVKEGELVLTQNVDYTVSYSNNKNAGEAKVIVTGKGNYSQKIELPFKIIKKDIAGEGINISVPNATYTGSECKPTPVIRYGNITLKLGTDYTLSYADNKAVGLANITIKGINNYEGTTTVSFRICDVAYNISKAIVNTVPTQEYTGAEITPSFVVKTTARVLTEGTDYIVKYSNNVKVGTATATIEGVNEYSGTKKVTFKIGKASLANATVIVNNTSVYTGKAVKPAVDVYVGDVRLSTKDYTVKYSNNIKAGEEAQVVITGKGSYCDSYTEFFTILPKAISDRDINFTVANIKATGTVTENNLKITATFGKTKLVKGKDYTVSFSQLADKEIQTVTIQGSGNFRGSILETFRVYSANRAVSSGNISVALDSTAFEYTGKAIMPGVTIAEYVNGEYLNLIEGVDYKLTYSNNTKAATVAAKNAPQVKITGIGAYTGSVVKKFDITPINIETEGYLIEISDAAYTGKEVKPSVSVMNRAGKKLKSGTDYTVTYKNNKNVASLLDENAPQVMVKGKGNYVGTLSSSFTIYQKKISSVTVASIPSETYTGSQIRPNEENIKVYADKKKKQLLTLGVDYTITYGDNIKAGKGTVIITGIGNYGGTKTVTFTILPKWLSNIINK